MHPREVMTFRSHMTSAAEGGVGFKILTRGEGSKPC